MHMLLAAGYKGTAVPQVHKLKDSILYESTPGSAHMPIQFPTCASTLATYFQGCLDHWGLQGFDSTVTGELVVDNLWQTPYEAHCLKDNCGSTVFTRTNFSHQNDTGLRCGKGLHIGLRWCLLELDLNVCVLCLAAGCGDVREHIIYPKFVGVIYPDCGSPVTAVFQGPLVTQAFPDFDRILQLHLQQYDGPEWRDLLSTLSCRATFHLHSSHVNALQHEVIDLTDDAPDIAKSTPDRGEDSLP